MPVRTHLVCTLMLVLLVGAALAAPPAPSPTLALAPSRAASCPFVAAPALATQAQAITCPDDVVPYTSTLLLTQPRQAGPRLSFPVSAATTQAVRRMAGRAVKTVPNRCAATVREAMGWGLGDAHEWVKLQEKGFHLRPPGRTAQPGDIVVWPFTYGRRRSEHIGIAVGTDRGTMLLSNIAGSMTLSRLVPGYRAFYRLLAPATAGAPESPPPQSQ